MGVSISRCFVCWAMVVTVPLSLLGQTPSAILHTQGGVWVNGYEARDSTAVFPGDLLETKPGFSANLSLEGSTVLIQPESVAKFQGDLLLLDHGGVSVGTSKSFKVEINCITVTPVSNEWTQYDVTAVNRIVQVAAHKNDVNVDHGAGLPKPGSAPEALHGATVHEGQQTSMDESQVCGAPARPTGAGIPLSMKWIAIGAGGTGILIWLLLHGGGKPPVSASQP